jgi:hypothetical protein
MDEDEAKEKKAKNDKKLLKRELPALKDGWLDKTYTLFHTRRDRRRML